MILRKVIIDGKEMFIPISKEEALQLYKDEELIFSSDDEKEAFYDEVEDLEDAVDPDEVIDAMKTVGEQMPPALRETGEGGCAACGGS